MSFGTNICHIKWGSLCKVVDKLSVCNNFALVPNLHQIPTNLSYSDLPDNILKKIMYSKIVVHPQIVDQ